MTSACGGFGANDLAALAAAAELNLLGKPGTLRTVAPAVRTKFAWDLIGKPKPPMRTEDTLHTVNKGLSGFSSEVLGSP